MLQAVEKQQAILKKIWNEITSPEMALKSGKKSPAPVQAAEPPPVVSVSNVEGDAVSSADAAASVATTTATTLPGPTQLVRGEYTSIHSGDELMQLLNDNPTDAFVLMVRPTCWCIWGREGPERVARCSCPRMALS